MDTAICTIVVIITIICIWTSDLIVIPACCKDTNTICYQLCNMNKTSDKN